MTDSFDRAATDCCDRQELAMTSLRLPSGQNSCDSQKPEWQLRPASPALNLGFEAKYGLDCVLRASGMRHTSMHAQRDHFQWTLFGFLNLQLAASIQKCEKREHFRHDRQKINKSPISWLCSVPRCVCSRLCGLSVCVCVWHVTCATRGPGRF